MKIIGTSLKPIIGLKGSSQWSTMNSSESTPDTQTKYANKTINIQIETGRENVPN